MVVRGTPRDSLYTLDSLLNLDGGVKPEMVATDNASYSDMAFGLYKMLGFRFARASETWPTRGSVGPTCSAARSRPPGTGRWRPWPATR
ncbi:hypothetical protein GCM10023080_081380 [Streptomyces pseudoechinosporeus]